MASEQDVFDRALAGDAVRAWISERSDEYGLQSKLARSLGVTATAVNRWTFNNGNPDPDYWAAIEEFFDRAPGTLTAIALGAVGGSDEEILASLIEQALTHLEDRIPKRSRSVIADTVEQLRDLGNSRAG